MKKVCILITMLLMTIIFISCSYDDDGDISEGKVSAELNINDKKAEVISDLSNIAFRIPNLTGTKSLTATIFINEDNSTHLSIQFLDLDLEDINVGDDLSNNKWYETTLYYKKEMYLLNNLFVENKNKFEQYKGQVIVKEYDKSNQIIKLEFKNITLPLNRNMYPDYNSLMKINGHIKCKIDID